MRSSLISLHRPVIRGVFPLLLLAAGSLHAERSGLSAMGWMPELAGACWEGRLSDGELSDTQCYEVQFGHFLRGSIAIGPDAGNRYEGHAVFRWDEAVGRIHYWFWSNDGRTGEGEGYIEGERLIFPVPAKEPQAPAVRNHWRRIDRDRFEVVREQKQGENWMPLFTVIYRRSTGN